MNKLLLCLAGAALAVSASATEVTFNFANPSSFGVTAPEPEKALVVESFSSNGITVTIEQGTGFKPGQELRFFTSKAGATDFRCSATGGGFGHKMTVTSTNGENINQIVFTGTTAFTATPGTYNNDQKTWGGDAASVTFTTTGQVKLTEMKVTTGQGGITPPPAEKNVIFSETFASSLGDFTTENVTMPSELTYVWSFASGYGAKASGYVGGTNYATEAWLISPVIDLAGATDVELTFDHATNFFASVDAAKAEATAWIREEGGQWAQLNFEYPASMSWTFVSAGTVDINSYAGKKVQLGFKYISTDAKAGTWEVKNVTVKANGGTTPPIPPTPETEDFTLATSITSGSEYVFVANGQLGTAIAESASYGRLTLVDATIEGTTVKAAPVNAITITAEGTGYTLKDSYGRYLAVDDSHFTSFQCYTALNEFTTWNVAFDGSNAIFSVDRTKDGEDKHIVIAVSKGAQGTWYSNLAPAAVDGLTAGTDYILPNIYVKASTAVSDIVVDADAPVEYYNLQGIRVANPENGIYIRRQGNSVSKVYVR